MKIISRLMIAFCFAFSCACSSVNKSTGGNNDDVYFSPPKGNGNDTTQKSFSPNTEANDSGMAKKEYEITGCITLGILQGGGSLFGFDMELPLSNHVGVQYGAGFFGAGGSVCYHFLPSAYRSFLAFNYWYQGFGDNHAQSLIGPSYVYRSNGFFTAQLGFGYITDRGPLFEKVYKEHSPDIILTYSIGIFFFTSRPKK